MNDDIVLAGGHTPKRASDLVGKTHREAYPEQYNHPAVGKFVKHDNGEISGTVYRVVNTRWGPLAHLEGHDAAYLLTELRVADNG